MTKASISSYLPGRSIWVVAHRWAGLTIALFLAVAGVTGATLPWSKQLTWASAPGLYAAAPPRPGARAIPRDRLAAMVEAETGGFVYAPLDEDDRHAVEMFVSTMPDARPLPYDEVVVDPYSGEIRRRFRYGHLADGPQTIMAFVISLHYSLAAGPWGQWAFGIAALIWTLDCFVGFYLTLPVRRREFAALAPPSRNWWSRWRPAWTIRRRVRGHKLHFDLHRAGGLWLWPILLVFAWSSFGLNLPQVHDPIMRLLGKESAAEPPALAVPVAPAIGVVAAAAAGRQAMIARGRRDGFTFEKPESILYAPLQGAYRYAAHTSLDPSGNDGSTLMWISERDGRPLLFRPPVSRWVAGAVDDWMTLLHFASVFGLPYRIFVSFMGFAVAGLSVTGILIWTKKRSARLLGARRRRPRCEAVTA